VAEIGSHDREAQPRLTGYCRVNSHDGWQRAHTTPAVGLETDTKQRWPNPVCLAVEEQLGLFQYLAEHLGLGRSGDELRSRRMNLVGSDCA
jgi:hypothetical protein